MLETHNEGHKLDRSRMIADLLSAKRRWDWIDGELSKLRDAGKVRAGMKAEIRAQIILDAEGGIEIMRSIQMRAPDFVCPEPPPMEVIPIVQTFPSPVKRERAPRDGNWWMRKAMWAAGIFAAFLFLVATCTRPDTKPKKPEIKRPSAKQ